MPNLRCSFCDKAAGETERIISRRSRNVHICNECVAVCVDILRTPLTSMDENELLMAPRQTLFGRIVDKLKK